MSALIRLNGVTKRYDDSLQPALERVDLDIEPGRITAIMGPSGGGKSTLLNLIGGLDRPTRGDIEVAGVRVDRLSETGPVLGAASVVLLPTWAPISGVAAASEAGPGVPSRARDQRAPRSTGLADKAGTSHPRWWRRTPTVAIARAIVNRPAVLLADEPTGALDRRNGENALAILEDLNRRGQTILLVTHDEQLAQGRAHRIIHLVDGAITGDRAQRMVA